MIQSLIIPQRFCGPLNSANGGYCGGLLASFLPGIARATLRKPIPLDKPLHVEKRGESVRLLDGDTVLADAESCELTLEVPPPLSLREAEAAAAEYLRVTPHPSPTCFVCSPQRAADGMRIYAGPAAGRTVVAAPWTPDESRAGRDGAVRAEFLWAALDCPGFWAAMLGETPRMALLGQMTVRLDGPVRVGEPCIVLGWPLVRSGRKHRVGTALFTATGELRGRALAIWIEPSAAP